MSNIQKALLAVLAIGTLASLALGIAGINVPGRQNLGGSGFFEQYPIWFGGGLSAGSSQQMSVSSAGLITTSGGITTSGAVTNTSTFTMGSTSPSQTHQASGTCNIQANATTIAASSTKVVDCQSATNGTNSCALSGVLVGDRIQMTPPTTTPTTSNGIVITGASASSTAGCITLNVSNLTGTTFTWTAGASSSWQYWATR